MKLRVSYAKAIIYQILCIIILLNTTFLQLLIVVFFHTYNLLNQIINRIINKNKNYNVRIIETIMYSIHLPNGI